VQEPATPDDRPLPENAARLIIEAWIKELYGDGYSYSLQAETDSTSWAWWINSHPYEALDAEDTFDGGTCWIDFEGKISDYTSIPVAFNVRLQATPPAAPAPEGMVLVTRDLVGAACAAIEGKRDAPKTLEQLRRYTTGDLSTPPPPAPAPVPLTDLGTLQAIVDEYYAWIRHHAAGHDYDDFLRNRGITASPEKGKP
jgi:hypothetical protein